MISLIYWSMQIGILTFATPGKQRTILKPSPTEYQTQLYPLPPTLYNRIPNTTLSSSPNSPQLYNYRLTIIQLICCSFFKLY